MIDYELEYLDRLYRAEQSLMQEWQKRWREKHGQYKYFNADGIVDYDRWGNLPAGKHILVILKETNGLETSLTEFLRTGGSDTYYRTWNNVARWVKMILDGVFVDCVSREMLNDAVRNIAVINLKKYAGGATANNRIVKKEALLDVDLLRKQIGLYRPDVILTGGWGLVSDFVHNDVFREDCIWYDPRKRESIESEPNLWYYWTDKSGENKRTLVVSMPHPNRASKKWTLELKKIFLKEQLEL